VNPEQWERLKSVFSEALARPVNVRDSFVGEACGRDHELKAEVQRLLAAYERAGSHLSKPAVAVLCDASTSSLDVSSPAASIAPCLDPGTILAGKFLIVGMIARGGMGEVYLAEDTILNRTVAIKLLTSPSAADEPSGKRLIREAQSAARLDHPNICAIYEVVKEQWPSFIVMQFLEGETLATRIQRGPLALGEVLNIAVQVATALAVAHGKGIVHRDIKPQNIMLMPGGLVKVLDFGLAKWAEPVGGDAVHSVEPTDALTEAGTIVGTVAYMSPEQAEGKPVDARSDIFSFGSILYEMVTGRRAFRGNSKMSILAAVRRQDPEPIRDITREVPQKLDQLITRCLMKDPGRRFQQIVDIKAELEEMQEKTANHRRLRLRYVVWAVGAMSLVAAFLAWRNLAPFFIGNSSSLQMQVVPITSFPGVEEGASFSPDGNLIAFSSGLRASDPETSGSDIYVMPVGGSNPLRLTNDPAGSCCPAWSPDGREIAFIRRRGSDSAILAIGPQGGPERILTKGVSGDHFSWARDGKSLAFSSTGSFEEPSSIYTLSLDTLKRRKLTSPPAGILGDFSPAFAPDGRHLGFVRSRWLIQDIEVIPSSGGDPRTLTTFEGEPGNIFAWSPATICWTADNRDIVFPMGKFGIQSLWRISISGGSAQPIQGGGEDAYEPAISASGDRLVYTQKVYQSEIRKIRLNDRDAPADSSGPLISSTRPDATPVISPDGTRIAFTSKRSGRNQIWVCKSNGSDAVQLTNLPTDSLGCPFWSPDGHSIAFDSSLPSDKSIYVLNADSRQVHQIITGPYMNVVPSWSRDGHWIYYGSTRSGNWQVWKVPVNGGEALQVTRNGGFLAYESEDSKYLYFNKHNDGGTSIWRIPIIGGQEQLVLEGVPWWGCWTVAGRGIYFAGREKKSPPCIEFLDFATRRITRIASVTEEIRTELLARWLSVSPDETWVVYASASIKSDIRMIEHFH
jgi:serine/threonine protein kinase